MPADLDDAGLKVMAYLLSSYITNSHDLVETPSKRATYLSTKGCHCDICTILIAGPNVQPKAVDGADKRAADRFTRSYLERMASEIGLPQPSVAAKELSQDVGLRPVCALAAYGAHLIERCEGSYDPTAAALVLWRRFAWTSQGSPKRDFELTADGVLEAEAIVFARLRSREE